MKRNAVLSLLLFLIMSGTLSAVADERAPILVTPAWLAEHLNDPDLVVRNVAQNIRFYRQGHVPGARFLWITSLAAANPELSFELGPLAQLDTLMEGLG